MQDLALSSSDSQNILSNPKNKDDSADSIAFLACEAYLGTFSKYYKISQLIHT